MKKRENPPRSCTCSRRALCRLRNLTADICSRSAGLSRHAASAARTDCRAGCAAVWCDTQVSGGSLEGYLRGLLPVWGERLWVYLAPIRMLFPVPCPSGVGTPLDETAADALTARHPSHFSPELVCRYCFFRDEDGDAHVFLYDTEETCREKLNLLRRLGVRRVFGEIPQT